MSNKLKLSAFIALILLVLLGIYTAFDKLANLFPSLDKAPVVGGVLPKDDKRQLVINPVNHTLIVTDEHGSVVTHLPDRPSVVDIKKDGSVSIIAAQLGFELRPFIGYGFGNQWRGYLGLDLGFFKEFDGGLFLSIPLQKQTTPLVGIKASYNILSHTQVFIGVDNQKNINAGLALRF